VSEKDLSTHQQWLGDALALASAVVYVAWQGMAWHVSSSVALTACSATRSSAHAPACARRNDDEASARRYAVYSVLLKRLMPGAVGSPCKP
jgi:hypothetical protein